MPPKGKGKVQKKVAAKGYELPEPIPLGTTITDLTKKSYTFGPEVASGGFGTVYFASTASGGNTSNDSAYEFVVKVEPHGNGPLFTEMHCYQNLGKPAQIEEYIKQKKLTYLGLSPCVGTGSFMYNSKKYRFMVIKRYGKDLQALLNENGHVFQPKTVYLVGLSLLTTLEYIHSNGYVHGDIKPANLLLGHKRGTENQVYLVDMGLANRYIHDGNHRPEKPDPKKAHDGTPEYTSRDAHRGCSSRRSDLEILCYNLLKFLVGELPWECHSSDCKKLQEAKERHMGNVGTFLKTVFGEEECPAAIKKLFTYVTKLAFEEEPDYKLCKKFLTDELKLIGGDKNSALEFQKPSAVKRKAPAAKSPKESSNKENAKKSRVASIAKDPLPVTSLLNPGEIPTPAMLDMMKRREEKALLAKKTKTRPKK